MEVLLHFAFCVITGEADAIFEVKTATVIMQYSSYDVILLGYGVVSVSDRALELLAGFSDFSHHPHALVLLPERAHLYREQHHLQIT